MCWVCLRISKDMSVGESIREYGLRGCQEAEHVGLVAQGKDFGFILGTIDCTRKLENSII